MLVLVSLALLIGFLVLTQYEMRHGMRFFAPKRQTLDTQVARAEFIIAHVDFAAFARDEIRHATNRLVHVVVNASLQAIRAIERVLTRAVRSLRIRYADTVAPRENAREFVKTLSDFKETLKTAPPEIKISDVE